MSESQPGGNRSIGEIEDDRPVFEAGMSRRGFLAATVGAGAALFLTGCDNNKAPRLSGGDVNGGGEPGEPDKPDNYEKSVLNPECDTPEGRERMWINTGIDQAIVVYTGTQGNIYLTEARVKYYRDLATSMLVHAIKRDPGAIEIRVDEKGFMVAEETGKAPDPDVSNSWLIAGRTDKAEMTPKELRKKLMDGTFSVDVISTKQDLGPEGQRVTSVTCGRDMLFVSDRENTTPKDMPKDKEFRSNRMKKIAWEGVMPEHRWDTVS